MMPYFIDVLFISSARISNMFLLDDLALSDKLSLFIIESNDEYKSFILQGTNSSESVKARLDYWRGIIRKLDWQK